MSEAAAHVDCGAINACTRMKISSLRRIFNTSSLRPSSVHRCKRNRAVTMTALLSSSRAPLDNDDVEPLGLSLLELEEEETTDHVIGDLTITLRGYLRAAARRCSARARRRGAAATSWRGTCGGAARRRRPWSRSAAGSALCRWPRGGSASRRLSSRRTATTAPWRSCGGIAGARSRRSSGCAGATCARRRWGDEYRRPRPLQQRLLPGPRRRRRLHGGGRGAAGADVPRLARARRSSDYRLHAAPRRRRRRARGLRGRGARDEARRFVR